MPQAAKQVDFDEDREPIALAVVQPPEQSSTPQESLTADDVFGNEKPAL